MLVEPIVYEAMDLRLALVELRLDGLHAIGKLGARLLLLRVQLLQVLLDLLMSFLQLCYLLLQCPQSIPLVINFHVFCRFFGFG